MGTRNITAIIKNGEVKLAQYGQWDGYFDYSGKKFIEFCLKVYADEYRFDEFKKKVDLLTPMDKKMKDKIERTLQSFIEGDVIIPFNQLFPQYSRDMGIEILNFVNKLDRYNFGERKFPVMINEGEWGACWEEYAYVIDLDEEKIYGFTEGHDVENPQEVTSNVVKENTQRMTCFFAYNFKDLESIEQVENDIKNNNPQLL